MVVNIVYGIAAMLLVSTIGDCFCGHTKCAFHEAYGNKNTILREYNRAHITTPQIVPYVHYYLWSGYSYSSHVQIILV